MKLRPCIDIHNGKVKQIVGSSLRDSGDQAQDNFVSEKSGDYYAGLYREKDLPGGHIIILNPKDSEFYEADLEQAKLALGAYSGKLQIGGGVNADNAAGFIEMGASHVIVTSYVFADGKLKMDRLEALVNAVGKEHLTLDLSCRRKGDDYYIVTDRWQKFTDMKVSPELFAELAEWCDEFLVHAVDVEGKSAGIDEELAGILAEYKGKPVTYAGGVRSVADIERLKAISGGRLDVTVGSALKLFGGTLELDEIAEACRK